MGLSLEMRKCWGRSRIDEVCPGGMLGSHLLFIHDIHKSNQALQYTLAQNQGWVIYMNPDSKFTLNKLIKKIIFVFGHFLCNCFL